MFVAKKSNTYVSSFCRQIFSLKKQREKQYSSQLCLVIPVQAASTICRALHQTNRMMSVFADIIVDKGLLSPTEMKEALVVHSLQLKCLHDLPDIRESKATEQIWQENGFWSMFKTCTTLCAWASQHQVERRLTQTLAARIQVGVHTYLLE